MHGETEDLSEEVCRRVKTNNLTICVGYIRAINSAKRDIIIANAYFLPDRSIRRALYRVNDNFAVFRGKKNHRLFAVVSKSA